MKKETFSEKMFRYAYQCAPGVACPGLPADTGASQSPFLSTLFNSNNDLATFFNTFFKGAIIVGAMLAVLRLGYAGFVYMTSDILSSKQSARDIITEATLGLMLLLAIWLILNQINPNLLNLNILQSVGSLQN